MALAFAALKRPQDAIEAAEKATVLARSHEDPGFADQVDAWLKAYRAEQAQNAATNSDHANPASPTGP